MVELDFSASWPISIAGISAAKSYNAKTSGAKIFPPFQYF
jgi:hypothetical protein